MSTTRATTFKKSNDILRERIKAIKPRLPNKYLDRIAELAPEYNTIKGAYLIRNIMTGRQTHVHVTEILEQIVREHEAATLNVAPPTKNVDASTTNTQAA